VLENPIALAAAALNICVFLKSKITEITEITIKKNVSKKNKTGAFYTLSQFLRELRFDTNQACLNVLPGFIYDWQSLCTD
jgi:hypothetical protein